MVGPPLTDLLVLNIRKSTDRLINWKFSAGIYNPNAVLPIAVESLPVLWVTLNSFSIHWFLNDLSAISAAVFQLILMVIHRTFNDPSQIAQPAIYTSGIDKIESSLKDHWEFDERSLRVRSEITSPGDSWESGFNLVKTIRRPLRPWR